MSLPAEEKVTCSKCGHQQPFSVWNTLDVVRNPELKARFLAGQLNSYVCAECGDEQYVLYPMLYYDAGRKLVIWLAGEEPADDLPVPAELEEEPAEDYRFRWVTSENQLREKVLIEDAGLDDRMVEIFKVLIRQSAEDSGEDIEGELFFTGTSEDEDGPRMDFVIVSDQEVVPTCVPLESYSAFANQLPPHLLGVFHGASRWLHVNETDLHPEAEDDGEE